MIYLLKIFEKIYAVRFRLPITVTLPSKNSNISIMKKSLLLSLALGAMGLVSKAATHNIYVANLTDWGTDVALYAWGDSEIFGGWPGATPSAQETIAGVTYDKFVVEGHDGETVYPIFNNNNRGQQVDFNDGIVLNEENYYFATNGITYHQYSDPTKPDTDFGELDGTLYVLDKTGWDTTYVYAWENAASEIFGGWPGTALTQSVEIEGETYKKVPFPGNKTITYNLIFNNNAGTQVEGISAIAGKDTYVEVTATDCKIIPTPGVKTYNIYIDDRTGWNELYLYAYVGASSSIFGSWPGVHVNDSETINGIEYKVIRNVEATEVAQNLIINNNAGEQIDVEGAWPIESDLFFTATKNGVSSSLNVVESDDFETEYYTLQGVRVATPTEGLYIVRKGSKVMKVIK